MLEEIRGIENLVGGRFCFRRETMECSKILVLRKKRSAVKTTQNKKGKKWVARVFWATNFWIFIQGHKPNPRSSQIGTHTRALHRCEC